jgi:hypothetical protein
MVGVNTGVTVKVGVTSFVTTHGVKALLGVWVGSAVLVGIDVHNALV